MAIRACFGGGFYAQCWHFSILYGTTCSSSYLTSTTVILISTGSSESDTINGASKRCCRACSTGSASSRRSRRSSASCTFSGCRQSQWISSPRGTSVKSNGDIGKSLPPSSGPPTGQAVVDHHVGAVAFSRRSVAAFAVISDKRQAITNKRIDDASGCQLAGLIMSSFSDATISADVA